jgi:fibro-slime domain-containing protein
MAGMQHSIGRVFVLTFALSSGLFSGCSASGGSAVGGEGNRGSTSSSGGSGGALMLVAGNGGNLVIGGDPSTLPAPEGCGNGVLTEDEACDDGNQADGDGCFANCLGVDAGFTCPIPGEACRPFARCGDGVLAFPEQCDDGAALAGDGCSPTCKIELGFKCEGTPSTCSATTCGDSKVEGAETCDDGNADPLDGCSPQCVGEPDCSGGACVSACGDGIMLAPETCDDGNTLAGDGCSASCEIEPGYQCTQDTTCPMVGGKCVLEVPAIFRDFKAAHSDFEELACAGSVPTPNIVGNALVKGKPVKGSKEMCSANLAQWYVDVPGTNTKVVSKLVLFDDGAGGFVNRYYPDGMQLANKSGMLIDGNPFFYPADTAPSAELISGAAVSGAPYTDGTTLTEVAYVPLAAEIKHNFGFTSEVGYWFSYNAASPATLEFNGDDDFWVFINGKLALDLGGIHSTAPGNVTLNPATATTLGLQDGKVYEIKIFHAERLSLGSTFKLTLSGFSTSRSDCNAVCGDGIIGGGEECDDGVNDGGYNECQAGCKLGPYCGDGVVDEGEDCDDGNRFDGDGCGSACRRLIVK